MQHILLGVRPICLGMVAGVVISLSLSNYWSGTSLEWISIALGAVDLVLLTKFKVGIPQILVFSAAAGLVLFGVLGLPL